VSTPDFVRAFGTPAIFWDGEAGHRVTTQPRAVGEIDLPTGRIAIHDPGYEFAPVRLDRDVPPGRYPVDLALRSWTAPDGTEKPAAIIAAARVRFSEIPARSHAPVRSAAGGDDAAVFGVDSGLIAVFDRSLVDRLGGAAILDAVPATGDELPLHAVQARIVPAPGLSSIFVCQAGKGDGAYLAWWGLDDEGVAVELVVDFGELVESAWRVVELPAEAFRGGAARLKLALAGTGVELEPVPVASIGYPVAWAAPEAIRAFRRPPGPLWEFTMLDSDGAWVGSPGLTQMVPGPWFELFELEKLERAETIRIRIHEGTRALKSPDTE
jgi:hypothetical protein